MSAPALSLYHYDSCPFCVLVTQEIKRLGLEVELRNVQKDPQHLQDLRKARGRTTVPVLRIQQEGEDRWMPESRDIVKWLKKNAKTLNAG